MKLTSIELHPANSAEVAVLSFRDPGSQNPFNVKTIEGLSADAIVPKFYRGSYTDNFSNMSLVNREVTLQIDLKPRYSQYETYSELRDSLYKAIASSRTGKVEIQFKNGNRVEAILSGYVSKLDSPLFEKTQSVSVTITCDDPVLRAPEPIITEPFAEAITSHNLSIDDRQSTASHGFYFELKFTAHVGLIQIEPMDGSWTFMLQPIGGFEANDILDFGSEYNNKFVTIYRPGTGLIPIADGIAPGSLWPILFPGMNQFQIVGTDSFEWQKIWHFPAFWGV